MSSKHTRQIFILEKLKQEGELNVAELSASLRVSQTTIRKDLENMAQSGQLTRVHGGARLSLDDSTASVVIPQVDTKNIVARYAASLISNGEIVFLGSGTTCVKIAQYLRNSRQNLTIISNNLTVLSVLSGTPNFTLLGTGGQLDYFDNFSAFHGDFTIQFLEKVLVQKVFLTADGISLSHGYTTHNRSEYHLYETIRKISEQLFFVVDSSKFNKNSVLRMADMNSIDHVITDSGIPEEYLNYYRTNKKHVYIAER